MFDEKEMEKKRRKEERTSKGSNAKQFGKRKVEEGTTEEIHDSPTKQVRFEQLGGIREDKKRKTRSKELKRRGNAKQWKPKGRKTCRINKRREMMQTSPKEKYGVIR